MKTKFIKIKDYKYILLIPFFILPNYTLAAEDGIFNNIVGFFTFENKKSSVLNVEKIPNSTTPTSTNALDMYNLNSASSTPAKSITGNGEAESEKINDLSTLENKKEEKEKKEEIFCEQKTKLNIKKEKINTQIKNQIKDKRVLVESLIEISSLLKSTTTKELVETKISELEDNVSSAVKIEKNIISTISSTTEIVCDSKNKKNVDKYLEKIKKIEIENQKQAEFINRFIKKEIKSLLIEINSND